MPRLAIVVLLCATSGTALAAETPSVAIDEAIASAKAAGKPLVLEFWTTWCEPCKTFVRDVLPDGGVQERLNGVTFVRYDAEAEPGLAAATKYRVNSYPTFLAVDGEGKERLRNSGSNSPAEFIRFLDDSTAVARDEAAVKAELAGPSGKDAAVRMRAARWYLDRDRAHDALAHLDAVAASTHADAGKAAANAAQIRRVDAWQRQLTDEKVALARKYPASEPSTLLLATVDSGLPQRDVDAIFGAAFAAAKTADQLNDLLYVALAAGATSQALAAAKRAMELAPHDPNVLDTVAEVYAATGDRVEALRIEDEAIADAKDKILLQALRADRDRYEKGGESPNILGQHKVVRDVRARLEKIERPDDEHSMNEAMAAAQQAAVAFHGALRKIGMESAKACATHAGKLDTVSVRLRLPKAPGPAQAITVLDPEASAALRTCLTGVLRKATFPAPMAHGPERHILDVPLGMK